MRTLKWAQSVRPPTQGERQFDVGVWPQVGAVLNHLSGNPSEADWAGSTRWDLDGSAVLIAPDYALTIRHVTSAHSPEQRDEGIQLPGLAAFFPSVGLVPVEYGLLTGGEERRDRLLALKLERTVPLPPIPGLGLKDVLSVREAEAVGFGDWMPEDGLLHPRGVQRRLCPTLLGTDCCTHDVCWNGDEDGSFEAGSNNSGGAVLGRRAGSREVAGILRRVRHDISSLPDKAVVAASKVSENRAGWLRRIIYDHCDQLQPVDGPPPVRWEERSFDRELVIGPIALPAGTVRVHATLSVARIWYGECYLQMHLLAGSPVPIPAALAAAAADKRSVGEYVARSIDVDGASTVTVIVAPLTPLAGKVRAQVCLRFVDAEGRMLG